MSIDVIERRRAVEQRLLRARNLARAIDQVTEQMAAEAGLPMDTLDPHGSLRTALSALAGVAALRPGFDVLLALPESLFALRLKHLEDDIDITLVRRDPPAGPSTTAHTTSPMDERPAARPRPEGQVASDLAAMLWQDVGSPSP